MSQVVVSVPKRTVLITGPFNQQAKRRLQNEEFEVLRCPANSVPEDLADALSIADAYILNGNEKVTAAMVENAPSLKLMVFPGIQPETYMDSGAAEAFGDRGVPIQTLQGVATGAVAELACGLILSCLRRVPFIVRAVQDGDWPVYTGEELAGKVLGICGMGKIGYGVAERMRGFRPGHLLYYDVVQSEKAETDLGAERVSVERLFQESDIISLHTPLTPETRDMVGESLLRSMKPTAVLVNTARPQIVDPVALRQVLEEWRIACAAFDGYYIEGPEFIDQMTARDPYGLIEMHDRFYATSHQGFNTQTSLREASHQAVDRVLEFFAEFRPEERAA